MYKILVVDDEESVRGMLRMMLEGQGYQIELAENGRTALGLVARGDFDLVITDLMMNPVSGMEVLKVIKGSHPRTQVMMMTAHGSIDSAVEAMKLGACDYIGKPFQIDELLLRVGNVLEKQQLKKEVEILRNEFQTRFGLDNIIGESKALGGVLETVQRVAPTESTVLITGETGTGKDLIARAVHNLSRRASKTFMSVNCAAFPEHLLESELFGHVKGAFTGASVSRKGLIEEADGGTFFLDEVGTTPPPIQAKLLRVLEDKTIRRIGENKSVQVDIRILAATNQDLPDLIKKREFREDLFYRLNVVSVHLPPLRARRSDIPLLAEHFLKMYSGREGKPITGFSPEAMSTMLQYDFPGNVRELAHTVEQGVAMAGGTLITSDLLPTQLSQAAAAAGQEGSLESTGTREEHRVAKALDERERELIIEAIDKNHGNLERVAHDLGMSRVTLWRRMKKYGIRASLGQGIREN